MTEEEVCGHRIEVTSLLWEILIYRCFLDIGMRCHIHVCVYFKGEIRARGIGFN
jgi:hypothetical protein